MNIKVHSMYKSVPYSQDTYCLCRCTLVGTTPSINNSQHEVLLNTFFSYKSVCLIYYDSSKDMNAWIFYFLLELSRS